MLFLRQHLIEVIFVEVVTEVTLFAAKHILHRVLSFLNKSVPSFDEPFWPVDTHFDSTVAKGLHIIEQEADLSVSPLAELECHDSELVELYDLRDRRLRVVNATSRPEYRIEKRLDLIFMCLQWNVLYNQFLLSVREVF